jgi:hypothetical protein
LLSTFPLNIVTLHFAPKINAWIIICD